MHDKAALNRNRSGAFSGFEPPLPPRSHNGGPPLDEHVPIWGPNGIGCFFDWKRAHKQAWKSVSRTTALRRLKKAEDCGLTYEEYTLVLLETGRFLQPEDREIIELIVAARE